jgi:hypothetical protein
MVTNISIPLAFKVVNRAPAVNLFSGNDMFDAATDMHVCDNARAHLVYVALAVIANAKRAVDEAESGLGQDLAFVPIGKERYTNLAVTERAHKRVKRGGWRVIGVVPTALLETHLSRDERSETESIGDAQERRHKSVGDGYAG